MGSKEEKNTGQAGKRTEIWLAERKREKSEAKEKWNDVQRGTIYRAKKKWGKQKRLIKQ